VCVHSASLDVIFFCRLFFLAFLFVFSLFFISDAWEALGLPPPQLAQIMENEEDENEAGEENIFHSLNRHRYAF
jgi:hypothetical protein